MGPIVKYNNIIKSLLCGVASVTITGCATAPPQDPVISINLKGTTNEVQIFIEENLSLINRKLTPSYTVDSSTDRAISFKSHCMNVPEMTSFSCALVMMMVGNSGWDGPYSVVTFRTTEYKGAVKVTASSTWCATNAFNKQNCGPATSNREINESLRQLEVLFTRNK